MKKSLQLQLWSLFLISIIFSSVSMANEDLGKYCGNDAAIHCAHVNPGNGRIGRCLALQKHKLSTTCQAVISTFTHILGKHIVKTCGRDIHRYCSATTPGNGRILRCLTSQHDKLSQPCSELTTKVTGFEPNSYEDY